MPTSTSTRCLVSPQAETFKFSFRLGRRTVTARGVGWATWINPTPGPSAASTFSPSQSPTVASTLTPTVTVTFGVERPCEREGLFWPPQEVLTFAAGLCENPLMFTHFPHESLPEPGMQLLVCRRVLKQSRVSRRVRAHPQGTSPCGGNPRSSGWLPERPFLERPNSTVPLMARAQLANSWHRTLRTPLF
jgi:hypothetical protein